MRAERTNKTQLFAYRNSHEYWLNFLYSNLQPCSSYGCVLRRGADFFDLTGIEMQTRTGLLLLSFFFCTSASADDWFKCPAGKYGNGGEYKQPLRCIEGVILAPNEEYCPATRGKYQPKYRKCIDGVDTLVGLSEDACMKQGGGYQLYGPQYACCIGGRVAYKSTGACVAPSRNMEKEGKAVSKMDTDSGKRDRAPMVWRE